MRQFYTAGDYAGLQGGGHNFYYGYEYDDPQEDGDLRWGFIHEGPKGGTRMSYQQARAQYPDIPGRFETTDCLLWFIAWVLENGSV